MDSEILEVEEWRRVPGRVGYEVSSFGRVRSWRRRGYSTKLTDDPRLLNPSPDRDGYLEGTFYEGARKIRFKVHVLVLTAFRGARPTSSHQCAHGDGNRQNNRLDNLRWATPLENARDCILHGNRPRGSSHPDAKLTEEMVREIRSQKVGGVAMAARFGVSYSAIKRVRSGKTWRHI